LDKVCRQVILKKEFGIKPFSLHVLVTVFFSHQAGIDLEAAPDMIAAAGRDDDRLSRVSATDIKHRLDPLDQRFFTDKIYQQDHVKDFVAGKAGKIGAGKMDIIQLVKLSEQTAALDGLLIDIKPEHRTCPCPLGKKGVKTKVTPHIQDAPVPKINRGQINGSGIPHVLMPGGQQVPLFVMDRTPDIVRPHVL